MICFLKRAYGPQIVFIGLVAFVFWRMHELRRRTPVGGELPSEFVISLVVMMGLPALFWYLSDVSSTGGRMTAIFNERKDAVLGVVPAGAVGLLFLGAFATRVEWRIPAVITGICDIVYFTYVLCTSEAYSVFLEHVAPKVQARKEEKRAQRERAVADADRQAARREAERFHKSHATLLVARCPHSLLHSYIMTEMHDGVEPAQAWAACRSLIHELTRMINEEREMCRIRQERENEPRRMAAEEQRQKDERAKEKAKRATHLGKEIAELEARKEMFQKDENMDEETKENEILAVDRLLRELYEQRNMLDATSD